MSGRIGEDPKGTFEQSDAIHFRWQLENLKIRAFGDDYDTPDRYYRARITFNVLLIHSWSCKKATQIHFLESDWISSIWEQALVIPVDMVKDLARHVEKKLHMKSKPSEGYCNKGADPSKAAESTWLEGWREVWRTDVRRCMARPVTEPGGL